MRLILAALLTVAPALVLGGCDRPVDPKQVSITDPSINLPAVEGRPAAGYFELSAGPDRGALMSVTSPQAGRVEMHEIVQNGSVASMRPVTRVEFGPTGAVAFEPGGRHLMLFDLDPSLVAGGEAELVFHFEHGEPVKTRATLHPPGGGHGH